MPLEGVFESKASLRKSIGRFVEHQCHFPLSQPGMERLEELFLGADGESSKTSLSLGTEDAAGQLEARAEASKESEERPQASAAYAFREPGSDFIFLPNRSSDAFKGFGVTDNYRLETGRPHPQVTFSFTEIEETQQRSPQGSLEPSVARASAPIVRYSFVREKPSCSQAQILTLSQNTIKISENSCMEVNRSQDLEEELWEMKQGHMISSVLTRAPLAPAAGTDPPHPSSFLQGFRPNQEAQGEQLKCGDFLSPVAAADLFITNMIKRAKAEHRKLIALYGDPDRWKASAPEVAYKLAPSLWPPIGHFSEKLGLFCVENYILTRSRLLEDWRYTISYQGAQSDSVSDHHYYQVEFGLPSKLYPVPQATASVHFYMEVSRVIPHECPVKVLLRPETAHFRSDPQRFSLNDYTLLNTMNMKLHHFRELQF
ncbi:uncharacterized protein LOC109544160 [Dendroctonus ponderosae]|uniref:uncharacterized protein LOC109544160 n=1 Tax=Dendroctonus ponderosae TaxID=77166 RepID=UPI002035D018|nr:uncharacterized protein LOC109544160 [Dendroctonus ponderosae]KAH1006406.1 hypothetical protein HUJ05_007145 [Dendroctonus ponderosae]